MRITVLTGGTSAERDVAIASAVQVVRALRARGHAVSVVDTARGLIPSADEPKLLSGEVGAAPPTNEELIGLERGVLLSGLGNIPAIRDADVLFLALHGGRGEDGTLQAVLEVVGIPYTGSGPLGSAARHGQGHLQAPLPAGRRPDSRLADGPGHRGEAGRTLGWPLIVKPSKQGSTVGLSKVETAEDFDAAVALAARYDDEVMIETYVPGQGIDRGGTRRDGPGGRRDRPEARDFRL